MLVRPGSFDESHELHVVTPVSNPARYHSRYRLYRQFEERLRATPGVKLHTVEIAYGDRQHEVTEAGNPYHLQLRTWSELWNKENAINLGVAHAVRLHPEIRYIAWLDADIQFVNPHWAQDTMHQLQHHPVVQVFRDCVDLGPRGEVLQTHLSFCHQHVSGVPRIIERAHGYGEGRKGVFPHPGFGWAARREAWDAMGGLIDWAILGAGDHHMALAMVGLGHLSMPGGVSDAYRRRVATFQSRCERFLRRDVGFVDGTILHHWHGKKRDRGYTTRWKILTDHKFDPDQHIFRDAQGLYQLDPDQIGLRDGIRRYLKSRNEDSIDID